MDCYLQKWNQNLSDTSKADSYREYKTLLAPEKYLSLNLSYSQKKSIARFRTSTHNLMIEKVMHLGLDRTCRLCPLCHANNISVVETEFHFLIECSTYENIRIDVFGNNYFTHRDIYTFNRLM